MVSEPFNPAVVAALNELTDDGSFFDEMLALFLEDLGPSLATMAAACERRDAPALLRSAHRVKSSAANVGAVRLLAACVALEAAAREGRIAAAVTEFATLRRAADEVSAWARRRSLAATGT